MNASVLNAKRENSYASAGSLLLALLLIALRANADTPTYYWDTNGSNDGAADDGNPTGDWYNTSANWTLDSTGNSPTFYYSNRADIVFTAADPYAYWTDTPDYTVTVYGIAQVSDIVFKDGYCTLTTVAPYYLDKDTPFISVLNQGQTATMNSVIASTAGTSNGITKFAGGTLVLGATNTYSGPTTIEGGTMQLGAPQVLPRISTLVLAGGDTRTTGYTYGYSTTAPRFATGGYSQTLGPLLLTGPYPSLTHTIDFGSGASALSFADSHTQNWAGIPLYLANYIPGVASLRFGTNSAGLTSTQLGLIHFELINAQNQTVDVPAKIDASGFVTPAPPVILSLTMSGSTNAVITWSAINGRLYLVHYKPDLNNAQWSAVLPNVTAAGSTASWTNNVGTIARRLYRVELLPIPNPD